MFGLGNRKVLKYSAIETTLSIDVEDTVTCFCRSVRAAAVHEDVPMRDAYIGCRWCVL